MDRKRLVSTLLFIVTITLFFCQAYIFPISPGALNNLDEILSKDTVRDHPSIFPDTFAINHLLHKLLILVEKEDQTKVSASLHLYTKLQNKDKFLNHNNKDSSKSKSSAVSIEKQLKIPILLKAEANSLSYNSLTSEVLLTVEQEPNGSSYLRNTAKSDIIMLLNEAYSEKDTLIVMPPTSPKTQLDYKTFIVLKRNPQKLNINEYKAMYAYVRRTSLNSDEMQVEWETWEDRRSLDFSTKLFSCSLSQLVPCESSQTSTLNLSGMLNSLRAGKAILEKIRVPDENSVIPEFDYFVDLLDDFREAHILGTIVGLLTKRLWNSSDQSIFTKENSIDNSDNVSHVGNTASALDNSLPQVMESPRTALKQEFDPTSGLTFPTNPMNELPLHSIPIFQRDRRKRSLVDFRPTNPSDVSKLYIRDIALYVRSLLSTGLFENSGWMTRSGVSYSQDEQSSQMFVSFSNCSISPSLSIEPGSTVKDIINFHANEVGISCNTNEIKKLLDNSACLAKLFILFKGQTCIALKMNPHCIFLKKSLLSPEDEISMWKAFELAMFSQAICSRKADSLQFQTSVSESIKIIEHMVLNGFNRAQSAIHFIKITRNLVKTAKSVFIKVLQDIVRYKSCEKCTEAFTVKAIKDARALLELILFCIESDPFTLNFQRLQNYRDVNFERVSRIVNYYIDPLK